MVFFVLLQQRSFTEDYKCSSVSKELFPSSSCSDSEHLLLRVFLERISPNFLILWRLQSYFRPLRFFFFFFSFHSTQFHFITNIGELIYCLIKNKTAPWKRNLTCKLYSYLSQKVPPPWGGGGCLFHRYWAPEARRAVYIFILKASVGYKLVTSKLQPFIFKFPLF